MLEANSRIKPSDVDLEDVKYDVDVLIIGGGGAGASAAIEADNAGAKVMMVTKLRIGDANTMMAEGGIQAADKPNDSACNALSPTLSAADILPPSVSCLQSLSATLPRL